MTLENNHEQYYQNVLDELIFIRNKLLFEIDIVDYYGIYYRSYNNTISPKLLLNYINIYNENKK